MSHDRHLEWTEEAIEEELLDSYGYDENQTGFSITTLDTAAWASRILLKEAREQARLEAWAEREIARIKEIVTRHATSAAARASFLEGHLHTYLNGLIEREEISKKSLDLPGGKIAIRSGREKIVIEDEDAVIAYLEAADETTPIKIKKSILKTELAKVTTSQGGRVYLNATDEPLPGTYAEPATDNFSFKPNLDEGG